MVDRTSSPFLYVVLIVAIVAVVVLFSKSNAPVGVQVSQSVEVPIEAPVESYDIAGRAGLRTYPASPHKCGDIDRNNEVNSADADLIGQHAVGNVIVSGACADVDGSGRIDINDALRIQQHGPYVCPVPCGHDISFVEQPTVPTRKRLYIVSTATDRMDLPSTIDVQVTNICEQSFLNPYTYTQTIRQAGWTLNPQLFPTFSLVLRANVVPCPNGLPTTLRIVPPVAQQYDANSNNDLLTLYPTGHTCGDMDNDNDVDATDSQYLGEVVAQVRHEVGPCQDIDRSNQVNSLDLLRLQQYLDAGRAMNCDPLNCPGIGDLSISIVPYQNNPGTAEARVYTDNRYSIPQTMQVRLSNLCRQSTYYWSGPTGPVSNTLSISAGQWQLDPVRTQAYASIGSDIVACSGIATTFSVDPLPLYNDRIQPTQLTDSLLAYPGHNYFASPRVIVAAGLSMCSETDTIPPGPVQGIPGDNPTLFGTVTYNPTLIDTCVNSTTLTEYYCIPGNATNTTVLQQDWVCIFNCTSGACQ